MTHFGRYRLSFLLSVLTFLVLASVYMTLPNVKKKLKSPKHSVIAITLVAPVKPVKKVIPKPVVPNIPQAIIPPTPIVKKMVIKKPIVKKVVKPKPKKIVKKPKKVIKRVVHKKVIHKKKVIKKSVPKKVIHKRVVHQKVIPQRVQRVEPVYQPPQPQPQPIIRQQRPPVIPVKTVVPTKTPIQYNNDNGQAKKLFLNKVRSRILANKKYPKLALRRHIEGAVKVRFDISANGQVTNIRFINGKSIFYKSIRKTLERTFPVGIPANMQGKLPIYDVTVTLHFNIN